jgi:hypothetical protein
MIQVSNLSEKSRWEHMTLSGLSLLGFSFFSRPLKPSDQIEVRSLKRNRISGGIFYIMGQVSKVFVHPSPPFQKRKVITILVLTISKATILSIPKIRL